MNILVTICARGGSKGAKNKNIRLLAGKPLIAHTIEQAKNWGRATDIIVSTDSEEIACIARDFGAQTPFSRPAHLASDEAPKIHAVSHALMESERVLEKSYGLIVDLDVTSPLRTREDLEACHRKFLTFKPNLVFSVVPAHRNPYFNMVEEDTRGFARLCKTLPTRITRRQDAPQVYDMNASIYFYSREFLLSENRSETFFDTSRLHVMDEISAYDIDRDIDFKFIEFLIQEGLVHL